MNYEYGMWQRLQNVTSAMSQEDTLEMKLPDEKGTIFVPHRMRHQFKGMSLLAHRTIHNITSKNDYIRGTITEDEKTYTVGYGAEGWEVESI